MKNRYKKKVWWSWLHLVVLIIGLLIWYYLGSMCVPNPGWQCFLGAIADGYTSLIMIFSLIGLYFIATLISWLCYKNKR